MQQTDNALLRSYVESHSDEAFAGLVQRHINLVYSVALRHVREPHLAEEITQVVFIILAKKAAGLRNDRALSSWLFQTARLTACNLARSEARRHRREQEAHMQSVLNESGADVWQRIEPLIDTAVASLGAKDRRAVLLRYYEGRNLRDVGQALGTSEDAAEKRVSRALEKLRRFLVKRGVASTAAIIAGAISANSVQAAPAALTKSVAAAAITKGGAAGGSTLTLMKGTLKFMAWTKLKSAAVAGAVIILAAGAGNIFVTKYFHPAVETVFQHPDEWHLMHAPAVLILRPSLYAALEGSGNAGQNGRATKIVLRGQQFVWVLAAAYGFQPDRMVLPDNLPDGKFDLLFTVPNTGTEPLRKEIESQFSLVGHREQRLMDGLALRKSDPTKLRSRVSHSSSNRISGRQGEITFVKRGMHDVADYLGVQLGVPVLDETGEREVYDLKLQWDPNLTGSDLKNQIERALRDEYGLELVPVRTPVEMLVVKRQAK